MTTSLYQ